MVGVRRHSDILPVLLSPPFKHYPGWADYERCWNENRALIIVSTNAI